MCEWSQKEKRIENAIFDEMIRIKSLIYYKYYKLVYNYKLYYNMDSIQSQIDNELVLHEKEPSLSLIINSIYVGNYAAALNKDILRKEGITHILNCGNDLKSMYPDDFEYLNIPLWDSEYTKVEKHLDKTNEFITKSNKDGSKVLVHCGAGMSRSVTIVLAYLIMHYKYTFSKAIALMKEKRPQVCPNQGFRKQMEQLSYSIHYKL